mgnify:CR=1 FL=1
MSLWRLEWLRLTRTRRWVALLGVYLFFGLLGPLTARYLGEILDLAGGELEGAVIELPPPTPVDGMAQFASNAVQIGTLVAVVVAAGALAIDAIPEMGVFVRTRSRSMGRVLVPRYVVATLAAVVAYVLGVGAAWYETWVLIGPPDAAGVLWGALFGALYLAFAVSVVALVAARASSVLGTVLISLVALLVLPILGVIGSVGRWSPAQLAVALADLAAGGYDLGDYAGAVAVTVVLTPVLLWSAVRLLERREP